MYSINTLLPPIVYKINSYYVFSNSLDSLTCDTIYSINTQKNMAKVTKILVRWLNNTPTDARIDKVISILDRYFPGKYEQNSTSHIVVTDERLKGVPNCGPDGDFSIPVKGGQKVKGFYLKRLAGMIEFLNSMEEE